MLRCLLVGSAQYILGPFGPDTDLRRFGLALAARGGKSAKKRAAVAVARKLAEFSYACGCPARSTSLCATRACEVRWRRLPDELGITRSG